MAKIKWTIELAVLRAKEFNTKTEFEKKYSGAVKFLKKTNMYNLATAHMEKAFKWSIELATIEAKKYNTRSKFEKNNKGAYSWIIKNTTKEERLNIYSHMEIKRESWSIKKILELTLKYNTFREFRLKEYAAYHWTKIHLTKEERDNLYIQLEKNQINKKYDLKDIEKIVSKYSTLAEFRSKNYNLYRWIYKNFASDKKEIIYKNMTVFLRKRDKKSIDLFKKESIFLTKSYNKKQDFRKENPTAYNFILLNSSKEEQKEIYSHMIPRYIITNEDIEKASLKYNTRADFKFGSTSIYVNMHKNYTKEEINIICSHMQEELGGFQPTKEGRLYYLKIEREGFPIVYKIGITNYTVKRRFGADMKYITILSEELFSNGAMAAEKELQILRKFKKFKYKGKPILKSGNSELFIKDILNLNNL